MQVEMKEHYKCYQALPSHWACLAQDEHPSVRAIISAELHRPISLMLITSPAWKCAMFPPHMIWQSRSMGPIEVSETYETYANMFFALYDSFRFDPSQNTLRQNYLNTFILLYMFFLYSSIRTLHIKFCNKG